jgi:hypothetical protein
MNPLYKGRIIYWPSQKPFVIVVYATIFGIGSVSCEVSEWLDGVFEW